ADHHLLVADEHVSLSRGPTENGHRPAVDPLFRSVARAFGARVIGVVLSGARDDGTAGLASIVRRGGLALVQDPADALHPSMPRSAIEHVEVHKALPAAALGPLIGELAAGRGAGQPGPVRPPEERPAGRQPAEPAGTVPEGTLAEEIAVSEFAVIEPRHLDNPAGFGCPSCHGALFALDGEPVPRYRCRVGHAWSPETLLEEQASALEGALWMALRSLEEKSALSGRMSTAAKARGSAGPAERYATTAAEAASAAALIRDLIVRLDQPTTYPGDTAEASLA
ncbi:MAG: two-component system, chemotaxis family, protein-glutamate methylesterase/glutaminase, partial [Cryptosporangiaceae bacterium]|nr:two-component system, chemotaxis family, protein-glutamate methylesterase/glutaminase [Cryptosporangiaceae bacterium]